MKLKTKVTKSRAAIIASFVAAMNLYAVASPASAQTETVLYSFKGGTDGGGLWVPVTVSGKHIYGTTLNGGAGRLGQVFSLTLPKGQTVWRKRGLFSFIGGSGGSIPFGRVTVGSHGELYGTVTEVGPPNSCCNGLVYELIPPAPGQTNWTYTILYSFTGGSDGGYPIGGLAVDANGALYGVAARGGSAACGTVFQLSPPPQGQTTWNFAVLYSFAGGSDGCNPNGDLLYDPIVGAIFGTTYNGGIWGLGTVYTLTPLSAGQTPWTKTGIHDFEGDATDAHDGANPNGGLVGGAGNLWGTTQNGGASIGCCGMVFQLRQEILGDPSYTLIKQHSFTGGQDGATPYAGLYKDASGRYWGTTINGGAGATGSNNGTIFEFYPDPRLPVGVYHYAVPYSFNGGTDGAYPVTSLTADTNGVLYGTTRNGGGSSSQGTVFSFVP